MKITLERVKPNVIGTRVTASTISFAQTGLVRISCQAVRNTGWAAGDSISIYRDDKGNLYVGKGPDFVLKNLRHDSTTIPALAFSNKAYVFQLAKEMDWPLGGGKMTHISYDLQQYLDLVNDIQVWKLV
jgi:hypothetical protein